MLQYVFPSTRSLLGSSTANRPQTTNKSPEMDTLKYPQNIADRSPNDTSKKTQLPSQQNLKQTRGIPKYHCVIWPHHLQFYKFMICAMSPYQKNCRSRRLKVLFFHEKSWYTGHETPDCDHHFLPLGMHFNFGDDLAKLLQLILISMYKPRMSNLRWHVRL